MSKKRELTINDLPNIKHICPYCEEEQIINYKHNQMPPFGQSQQCDFCKETFDWEVNLLGTGSVETFKQQESLEQ